MSDKIKNKEQSSNDTIHSVIGSEFTECIKTVVTLFEDKKVIVYVPKNFDATEHLNYYDDMFRGVGWVSWSKVN